jgi:hypothetical protein
MADANYSVVGISSNQAGGAPVAPNGILAIARSVTASPLTTSSVRLVCPLKDATNLADTEFNCVQIFGN